MVFPDHVSPSARTFISKLFHKEPEKRITAREILKDPFMQINSHDMKYINANAIHGFVRPADGGKTSGISRQESGQDNVSQ